MRRKKFRPNEMAGYCLGEATESLHQYTVAELEMEAPQNCKALLANTELVCAKDGETCVPNLYPHR